MESSNNQKQASFNQTTVVGSDAFFNQKKSKNVPNFDLCDNSNPSLKAEFVVPKITVPPVPAVPVVPPTKEEKMLSLFKELLTEPAKVVPVALAMPAILMLPVQISPKAIISFRNDFDENRPVNWTNVRLVQAMTFSIPEGTRVRFGNNVFVLVSDFRPTLDTMPAKPSNMKEFLAKKCPAGTVVIHSNGIAGHLASEKILLLPDDCRIILPNGTLLQQMNSLVKIRLEGDTEANIVSY